MPRGKLPDASPRHTWMFSICSLKATDYSQHGQDLTRQVTLHSDLGIRVLKRMPGFHASLLLDHDPQPCCPCHRQQDGVNTLTHSPVHDSHSPPEAKQVGEAQLFRIRYTHTKLFRTGHCAATATTELNLGTVTSSVSQLSYTSSRYRSLHNTPLLI